MTKELNPNQYQQLCLRTANYKQCDTTFDLFHKSFAKTYAGPELHRALLRMQYNLKISNLAMGLSGEAGELCDYLKKAIHHNHDYSTEHIEKEIGDILWYCAVLADEYGITLQDAMKTNIEKLKARYPKGFNVRDSKERKT